MRRADPVYAAAMNRPTRLAALLVALASAVAFGPGSTASAARGLGLEESSSKCPENAICVWENVGYQGRRIVVEGKGLSNEIGEKFNDQASSVKFTGSTTGILYRDFDGEVVGVCLDDARRRVRNLANASFDEEASSSRISRDQEPSDCRPIRG